ncbi:MAG: hypothetical protein ACI81P_001649 [Neolewinella sp.]|jgi:hypothetical protein
MRYLLFLLLASTTLFAQDGPTSSDKYVWAESGLVLRAEGNSKGKKLAVIPYGARVKLTGAWGDDLSVVVIPERTLEEEETPNWEMHGHYIGVSYEGQQGFAFSGYINGYDAMAFTFDTLTGSSKFRASVLDTLHYLHRPPGSGLGEISILYGNGITISNYQDQSGGGATMVIPNATLATGYLLAVKVFGLDHYTPNMEWENAYLIRKTPDSLTFKRDGKEITIKEYFGVVIITYNPHC